MAGQSKNKRSIWIIGAGFMGRGIAQICAQHGFSVSLIDNDKGVMADARKEMVWSLEKLFSKKQIAEDPGAIIKRVVFSINPDVHDKVDFLVECVPEDLAMKQKVLSMYDGICAPQTIFATNTLALPIGKLASATTRLDKFIGTHFASPPVIQKLVEIIPCLATTAETLLRTRDLLIRLEREIIEVKIDTAGFIMNRIYLAAGKRSGYTPEEWLRWNIDRAMRVGYAWSKGPLEAADLAGLDVIHGAMLAIWQETGEECYNPPQVLRRLVESGKLGRKSGMGFYEY